MIIIALAKSFADTVITIDDVVATALIARVSIELFLIGKSDYIPKESPYRCSLHHELQRV
ncbi:uncharacterized protein PHALS_05715 [Plasmopara halstedii]|uniref:Uncharacterized protein n=1 Tax=Plasmopara halstedii TaxID=4781 RepID=A0A0P1B2V1_PLAHL|nr:uncharacterized protein PHALS_05715 [Plasmopara halstedii]CEG48247.1 hypothetical protein PHALS_05715 [Plasmopara halstedii]|eukprot:XP_024584616.1 hypothetical protein PHALS_05715 [Plasmopara halstedii]